MSNSKTCPANRICPANRKCVLENFCRTAAEQRKICPVLGTNADTSSCDGIPAQLADRCLVVCHHYHTFQDNQSLSICVLSLPQEIEMFGQPLEICHAAQKIKWAVAKAVSNAAPALQLAASLPHVALFLNPNDMAAASTADVVIGVI